MNSRFRNPGDYKSISSPAYREPILIFVCEAYHVDR